jgi:FeS assembly SUF system protein
MPSPIKPLWNSVRPRAEARLKDLLAQSPRAREIAGRLAQARDIVQAVAPGLVPEPLRRAEPPAGPAPTAPARPAQPPVDRDETGRIIAPSDSSNGIADAPRATKPSHQEQAFDAAYAAPSSAAPAQPVAPPPQEDPPGAPAAAPSNADAAMAATTARIIEDSVAAAASPAPAGSDVVLGPEWHALPDGELREKVVGVLRKIYDPEIPVNIHDLGLIYGLFSTDENDVTVKMTLTSPNCPEAESLPPQVEGALRSLDGVKSARVAIVWEPAWSLELMTEEARLELNLF